MSHQVEGCTLEIDAQRGVIYVHGPDGRTLLRICSLPKPIPTDRQLDVTHMVGADWRAAPRHVQPGAPDHPVPRRRPMTCEKCGGPTFGRLCARCKGEKP